MAILGIMGGSFDPIHSGHIFMAERTVKHVRLDGVLFIPTGDPPHKTHHASALDRLRMVECAIENKPAFRASDIEIRRDHTTYTIDTLTQLRAENQDDQYVYIVGADTLMTIESWREFARIPPLLLGIACVLRPEIERREVWQKAEQLRKAYGLVIWVIDEMGYNVSSTYVRMRVERGLSVRKMLPDAVIDYIVEHRLYRNEMFETLRKDLLPERYRHTLGVERAALQLAARNDVDPEKARLAALLHDCAKCMSEQEMLALLRKHGMEPRYAADRTRTLMHAVAGMILAKEKYGVTDPEVLGAIRWHTTGRAGMTTLEKLIYLADVIEAGRRPFPALAAIRAATQRSLDEGMMIAAERTLAYLDQRGILPDPNTLDLLKDYQQITGKESRI